MTRRVIGVFARAPMLGRVKTRIAATLGEVATLALYEAFLDDTLAAAADAARRSSAALEVCVAGAPDHPAIVRMASAHGATITQQADGDLGAKMGAFLHRHIADEGVACVIGSDSPHLSGAQIARAFDALVGHEVVIGPSRDGGYWLLGARRPVPELLRDMAWSTNAVLSTTLSRLRARSVALLEMSFDVDDAEDIALLRSYFEVLPEESAPATRRALGST